MRDWLGWILAALSLAALTPAPAEAAEGDVSRVAPGATEVSVSSDGSVVGFVSDAALVENDRNGLPDVYVSVGGDVRPVTVPGEGQPADESSRGVELSRDGSTIAFFSNATDLVDGDTNGREDVFVADLATGEIRRVNLNQLGLQAGPGYLQAHRPSLSADGAVIAFADSARLTDDAPVGDDSLVYQRDLGTGATAFVAQGALPSLSGDGKTLAYESGGQVWAAVEGGTELVSANGSGEPGNASSREPDVNGDGSLIAFASEASDLGPGSENRGQDIFLRKRSGEPSTELVSLDDRSRPGAGNFAFPVLSDEGRYVAFRAEQDINGCLVQTSVEVRDRDRESTFRAARGLGNQLPDGPSGFITAGHSLAADGSVVGYPSLASNLVDADDNDGPDGFLTELGAIEDPIVFISQGPPRVAETASEMEFRYTVCQRAGRQEPFEFGFQTADGTATPDADFVRGEGNLSFGGTVTEVLASVQVLDDDVDEPWETVYLDGRLDSGAFVPARERGTIVDDEPDPGNGLVYFERNGEIHAVEPTGEAEPKAIVSGTDPAVSRDGQRLAFVQHTEGSPDELMISAADGSGVESVLVANGVGEGFGLGRPAWSPDGTRLAVTDFGGGGNADIAVVTNFETDEAETVLDDATGLGRTLSYSPEGAKLAFDQEGSVTTLDLDSGETEALADGEDPAYGPDGALVYTRSEAMKILPDGGAETTFEPADGGREAGFARPSFSPDGTALVYVVDEEGRYIETALRSNGDERQLTPDGSDDLSPTWAPAATAPLPTVSVGDASATEGSPLGFGIDLSSAAGADVTVTATTLAGTAGESDFTARSEPVVIPAGETHADFPVQTTADALDENDETVTVTLSAPSGALIADSSGVGTITDNDPEPAVSVGDASATEGDAVGVPITLSPVSGRAVTVRLSTAGGTASGDDYTAQSDVLVTIPPGQTQVTASVPTTEDAADEPDETFGVTISNVVNATLATTAATGTIVDDDEPAPPAATVSTPVPIDEGGTLAFPVELSHAAATDVTVRLSTGAGSATAGSDYTARVNVDIVIPAGETEGSFGVATSADALTEGDETVTAAIDSASGATVGSPSSAIGTIRDVPPPKVSIATAAADEGQPLKFPVKLDKAAAADVTVRLSTGTGSATANSDYTPRTNAEITIPAGQTQALFEVATKTDGLVEGNETVTATINGATGAGAGSPTSAIGTINDVPPPRVSIRTAAVDEGQPLKYPVKLDRAAAVDVTVRLSTGAGSATPSSDYTPRANAQITIPAGQTEAFFEVATIDDPLVEGDETVTASINGATGAAAGSPTSAIGTIRSTDLPAPKVSVGTPAVADEGSPLRFPLTLDRAAAVDVQVRVSTSDGTAVQPGDYTPRSSFAVTIPAGQTQAFADVATLADQLTESDETVKLSINGGTNVSAGSPTSATGTIRDAVAINLERGGLLGGKILSGTIKVKLPGGGGFIDLGSTAGLPVGTQVDATEGVIELTSAVLPRAKFASTSQRRVQRARFRDGIFTIRQGRRSALVTLVLSGPELRGCAKSGRASSAARKVRRLWGDGKGRFRTKGKFAAGTVRGTKWLTEDRCGSTKVRVTRGRVAVQDLVRKKTRVVRAGRSLTVRRRG